MVRRSAFGSISKIKRKGRRTILRARYTLPEPLHEKYPHTPKRVSKDFPAGDYFAARQWLDSEYKQMKDGTWQPAGMRRAARERENMTVSQYWQPWLQNRTIKGRPLKPPTVYAIKRTMRLNILPTLGNMRLKDITQSTLDQLETQLNKRGPTIAFNTLKIVHAMLRTATHPGPNGEPPILDKYPLYKSLPDPPAAHKPIPATASEVKTIYQNMPEKYRIAIYLTVFCGGLRIGEVCALQRGDIDLQRGALTVNRTRNPARAASLIGTPKTVKSRRTVPIPQNILPLVKQYLNEHVENRPDAWLFPGHDDPTVSISTNTMRRMFNHAKQAAGRPDMHFHDLRHTGLTWLAAQGATVRELMDEAGHATPMIAMHYQHSIESRKNALADKLGSVIEGLMAKMCVKGMLV